MNIFLLDTDPALAARYHCDKHVIKMPLECAQLLSTAMAHYGMEPPYKETHKNHPCAIWARQYEGNYTFLWDLALEIGKEYTRRYGKVHKSTTLLTDGSIPRSIDMGQPILQRSPLPNCTTIKGEYPQLNLVDKYRLYYMRDKAHMLTWKDTEEPWWMGDRFYMQQLKAIGNCPGAPLGKGKERAATKDDLAANFPPCVMKLTKADIEKLGLHKSLGNLKFSGDIPSGRLKAPYLSALSSVASDINWGKMTVADMTQMLEWLC